MLEIISSSRKYSLKESDSSRYTTDIHLNAQALEVCKEFQTGSWGVSGSPPGRKFVDVNRGGSFANLRMDGSSNKQLVELCSFIVEEHEDDLEKLFKRNSRKLVQVKDFVLDVCNNLAGACSPQKPNSRSRKEL